jgi:hypothetical protein
MPLSALQATHYVRPLLAETAVLQIYLVELVAAIPQPLPDQCSALLFLATLPVVLTKEAGTCYDGYYFITDKHRRLLSEWFYM